MSLGSTAQSLASTLIPKFGMDITLIRVTEGAYNTVTGEVTNTEASETVKALVSEVSGKYFRKNTEAEDKEIFLAGTVTKPELLDKFTIDGVTFTIAENGIKSIYAGDRIAMYVIHGIKA